MENKLENLKNKVFSKKGGIKETELTGVLDVAREFSCLGEIIGREFEIRDKNGNLIYTIYQKPIKIKQLNVILKELVNLKKIDFEIEKAKFGGKKGGTRLGR